MIWSRKGLHFLWSQHCYFLFRLVSELSTISKVTSSYCSYSSKAPMFSYNSFVSLNKWLTWDFIFLELFYFSCGSYKLVTNQTHEKLKFHFIFNFLYGNSSFHSKEENLSCHHLKFKNLFWAIFSVEYYVSTSQSPF